VRAGIALEAARLVVDAAELALRDVAVVAAQLLLGAQLHAVVGGLALPALAVLAGSVFALVDWALGAAPHVLAHAAVDLVLRLMALGHRVLMFKFMLRIAPSSVPARAGTDRFWSEAQDIAKTAKTAGRETPRGPIGPRDGGYLGGIGR
jgi:hypothetical protein